MKRDRELIVLLSQSIAEIAVGNYRAALLAARAAVEALDGCCSACGRPWRQDEEAEQQ